MDMLRANGGVLLSLVAIDQGDIVGHILFSPVTIESATGTTPAMKRAALYARTSRTGQHIDIQLEQLRQVAKQRGWEVTGEFVDDDVSSRRKHRPEFAKMLKAAEAGKLDLVVSVALDRYARSTTELLGLSENLKSWGVDFRFSVRASTPVRPMAS